MTTETRKPSRQVESELQELQEESAALAIEIAELEESLKAKKTRYNQLNGGAWSRGDGLLRDKQFELDDAKRYEDDCNRPVVVWKVADRWDSSERIVSRVTPKRIYIRKRGERRETHYNRDGTSPYSLAVIDVDATLAANDNTRDIKATGETK